MILNDLVDSFCYSQKNAGLKGLIVQRVRACVCHHERLSSMRLFGEIGGATLEGAGSKP